MLRWIGLALVVVVAGCAGGSGGSNRPPVAPEPDCNGVSTSQSRAIVGGGNPAYVIPETSIPRPGDLGLRAHTNTILLAGSMGGAAGTGLTPAQVRGAYGVGGSGSGAIAVVAAYHYPTSLNDFNVFAADFGLPLEPSSDPTDPDNAVLQVVYATGSKPADDAGWSQEMALDIEWAHAIAPGAKIYLVEAASALVTDLMHAVNVAKSLPNVRQVSMSFAANETGCLYATYNGTFLRNGVAFFGASGDTAGARVFPACSYNVVCVGGTSLTVTAGGVWTAESVWTSTGCGPSAFEPRPIYQDFLYGTVGLYRGGVDVAAVGDPNTGVQVYDSTPYQGFSGWYIVGGTSASTPIMAGCVNATERVFASSQALNTQLYSGIGGTNLHDIVNGVSGSFPATPGWDFASGIGTPNDLGLLFSGS